MTRNQPGKRVIWRAWSRECTCDHSPIRKYDNLRLSSIRSPDTIMTAPSCWRTVFGRVRGPLGGLGCQNKPDSTPGSDFRCCAGGFELFSQPRDVRIDDVGAGIEVHIPDLVVQLTASHRLTGVQHQVLEQSHLGGGDVEVLCLAGNSAGKPVQDQISDGYLLPDARAGAAANEGPHARAQLVVRDRLDDEVIRTRVESAHDRRAVALSGVEHDRRPASRSPQLLKNLEAVPVAKIEIEDDSVVVVDQRESSRFLSRRSEVDRVRLVAEYALHEIQDRVIIIDDQDTHAGPLIECEVEPRRKLPHYRGDLVLRRRGTGLGGTGLFFMMYPGSMRASLRTRAESSAAAHSPATRA